jgi:predicted porin
MRSLIVAAVLASGSVASAGTYIGLGIGTAPSESDGAASNGNQTRSWRALLGYSFGHLSIESELNRYSNELNNEPYDATMLGLGLKYNIPIEYGFELFARAGIERTWLSGDTVDYFSGAGNGLYLGVGVEYHFIPLASVFVDYERQSATITPDDASVSSYDHTAGMFTIGAILHL